MRWLRACGRLEDSRPEPQVDGMRAANGMRGVRSRRFASPRSRSRRIAPQKCRLHPIPGEGDKQVNQTGALSTNKEPTMKTTTTAPKIVTPQHGEMGFLGSIGVRFMIAGLDTHERITLAEHPRSPS